MNDGKWTAKDGIVWRESDDAFPSMIATIHAEYTPEGERRDVIEQRARIMAAGQEMLAALKMAECEMVTLMARVNSAVRKNLEEAVKQIRAAIAKAESGR